MHNSLNIRDLLKRRNSDPLCIERRDPHRLVACDPEALPQPGDITLDRGVTVTCEWPDSEVATRVHEDVTDFLNRMGVATITHGPQQLVLRRVSTKDLGMRGFRWNCQADGVVIEAEAVAGLWAGVAWLEFEMRIRRGPFLPAGKIKRRAAWEHQISQGPWGGNYSVPDFSPEFLSDDAFRLYAHYGITEMMVYGDLLCYTDSKILPELNHPEAARNLVILQDAARRAACYGVRFSYVVVGPKLPPQHPVFKGHPDVAGIVVEQGGLPLQFLCTESEEGHAFYREQFGLLFREVPQLAGLILIVAQESFYHCKMWWPQQRVKCPRCDSLSTEDVLAHILDEIQSAVREANPDAYVAAWPYTTSGWERPDRLEFIRRLPQNVAFMLSVEKDEAYRKDGYIKQIWDYSIDYAGPAEPMRRCAAACRKAGRSIVVKTETGIGLEVIQFPYVPAMQRLADKWQGVRDLAPFAVHQSWLFFGMFGSRAEALGLWAAYAPEMSRDAFLRQLAIRDFGPTAAPLVIEAWQYMSESMGRLPLLQFNHYYVGPSFLGPCHPLVSEKGMKLSAVFDGFLFYLQEGGVTFGTKNVDQLRTCLAIDNFAPVGGMPKLLPGERRCPEKIIQDEYGLATEAASRAVECLRQAAALTVTAADGEQLRDEALLTEAVYRTNRACCNTAHWFIARDTGDVAAMRTIALDERENALSAIPMYAAAPWLELNRRIDGTFSAVADMINEKVSMIDHWLQSAS